MTIPSKPPGTDTKESMLSTSSPDWVSSAAISAGLSVKWMYSLSLLIDIFIAMGGLSFRLAKKVRKHLVGKLQI